MRFLPEKTRQTVLEIDLKAIKYNFDYFFNHVSTNTKFVVVIKAFAYGAGIKNIAKLLETQKVAYLAVACIDEGVELKDAGIQQHVMILNPEPEGYHKLIEYGLEPVIYDFESLHYFLEALQKFQPHYKPYPVHIKIDSGMHRLGFYKDQLPQLLEELLDSEPIKVQSILSHLVASDNPEFDDYTNEQINLFTEMSDYMIAALGYDVDRHILNSGGIERFPNAEFEMVRLGIGLYGISIDHSPLKNVYTWKTTIAQIKEVTEGDSVGYNRAWYAKRNSKIATAFVGYADGLNRKLSNGNWNMKLNGVDVPIVGNICMDLCMLDVTDVECNVGDELIIFNSQKEIYSMAKSLGTIHYEVLTNISKRVKRVYLT